MVWLIKVTVTIPYSSQLKINYTRNSKGRPRWLKQYHRHTHIGKYSKIACVLKKSWWKLSCAYFSRNGTNTALTIQIIKWSCSTNWYGCKRNLVKFHPGLTIFKRSDEGSYMDDETKISSYSKSSRSMKKWLDAHLM